MRGVASLAWALLGLPCPGGLTPYSLVKVAACVGLPQCHCQSATPPSEWRRAPGTSSTSRHCRTRPVWTKVAAATLQACHVKSSQPALCGAPASRASRASEAVTCCCVHRHTTSPQGSSQPSRWQVSVQRRDSLRASSGQPGVPAGPVTARSSVAMEGAGPGSSSSSRSSREQWATPGVRTYTCDHCGKVCSTKAAIASHVLSHFGKTRLTGKSGPTEHTGGRTYTCDHCGKTFANKSRVARHILTHTGERKFQCLECGKRFTQKGDLNTHILTHTGERKFQCLECGKRFTEKGTLDRHILTHTGERKFQCLECGKRFTQKGTLDTHILTHTGERKFQCLECGKRFTQKGDLDRHILTHTGRRPSVGKRRK